MPDSANIEADPFFDLLTDALRAGPGSPQWHQAVAKLKTDGDPADEYRLLVSAREHLESGKEFRTVRAGPGFTRKLFEEIEEQATSQRRHWPTANLIAIFCAAGILIVLTTVALLLSRGSAGVNRGAIDDLAATYFSTDVAAANFDGALPAGWRTIGSLALDATSTLRPSRAATQPAGYLGGGIVAAVPLPAGEPFALEASIVPGKSSDVLTQLFVSDSADFSPDRATTPRELVWLLDARGQDIVVAGRGQLQASVGAPADKAITVRLIVDRDLAIIEADGKRLWAGAHGLKPDQPRYAGVRFIRGPSDKADGAERFPSVHSLRVQKRGQAAAGGDR